MEILYLFIYHICTACVRTMLWSYFQTSWVLTKCNPNWTGWRINEEKESIRTNRRITKPYQNKTVKYSVWMLHHENPTIKTCSKFMSTSSHWFFCSTPIPVNSPLEADTRMPSLQLDSQSPYHLEAADNWAYTSRSKYLSRKGRKSYGNDQGAIEPLQYAVLILAWERGWRPEGRHVSSAPRSMGDVCPQAISKGLGQGALVNWKLHPQHPCSLPWLPQSNLQENVQWCKYHAAAA